MKPYIIFLVLFAAAEALCLSSFRMEGAGDVVEMSLAALLLSLVAYVVVIVPYGIYRTIRYPQNRLQDRHLVVGGWVSDLRIPYEEVDDLVLKLEHIGGRYSQIEAPKLYVHWAKRDRLLALHDPNPPALTRELHERVRARSSIYKKRDQDLVAEYERLDTPEHRLMRQVPAALEELDRALAARNAGTGEATREP